MRKHAGVARQRHALEKRSFDLPVEFTHGPPLCRRLLGVKLAFAGIRLAQKQTIVRPPNGEMLPEVDRQRFVGFVCRR